jgi:hypothetical protein
MRPFQKRHKYGAIRTNGYASKREAEYAESLRLRKLASNGDVLYWIEQVPVKLSIGRITIDFLVFTRDGGHEYVEVKGKETRDFKLRMLALQNEHPEVYSRLGVVG